MKQQWQMKRLLVFLTTLVIAIISGGCKNTNFSHEVSTEAKPWKHETFDNRPEKVQFAIFSDLTGGERAHVFEVAVEQLNLLRPELIVNVGDLMEGGTNDKVELNRQWDSFDGRAAKAQAPIFYKGGNHDLTGEVLREVWADRHGPRYYHFVYRNVLFLILDAEDNTVERMREIEQARIKAVEIYKTKGPKAFAKTEYAKMPERTLGTVSKAQSDYFIKAIKNNPNVMWTFVFVHKPVWKMKGEQNFLAMEKSLLGRGYTVFNGHTHVYGYEERFGRDYINLATTGGEQYPKKGRSMDHLTWVTVDRSGVSIANLLMEGILDKTGKLPLNGSELNFEAE